jgi:hypothetical protein
MFCHPLEKTTAKATTTTAVLPQKLAMASAVGCWAVGKARTVSHSPPKKTVPSPAPARRKTVIAIGCDITDSPTHL